MDLEDAFKKRIRSSGVEDGSSTGGPDRLSSLPDCLLHTIMYFLKARQVVQTCVLSTRWRYLWRSVPCLDIDFDEFKNKATPSDDSSSSDDNTSDSDSDNWHNHKDWKQFTKFKDWEDFAVTLMRRCNIAQLDSFRLHSDQTREPEYGNRVAAGWLRRAMKYCTLDSASPQGLSSGSWRHKRLHLGHILLGNDFLKQVSSVCPSLEDLELDHCYCEFQSITSQSLKSLVLKRCRWRSLSEIISPTLKALVIDGGWNTDDACVLVILAPSVAYLHLDIFVGLFSGGVSLKEMPYVAKALIELQAHKYASARNKLGGDQFKLLCSISNSTNLELKGVGTNVLGKEPRFQEFKNLRSLLLDRCDLSDDFKTLVFFLRGSPILEKLTLRCCEFPKYSSQKKGTSILKNSSSKLRGLDFLCENLKVDIIYNDGDGSHLMQLLLRISVNLSKNNVKLTKVN